MLRRAEHLSLLLSAAPAVGVVSVLVMAALADKAVAVRDTFTSTFINHPYGAAVTAVDTHRALAYVAPVTLEVLAEQMESIVVEVLAAD
jgi:hypothetical protein